MYQVLYRKYRPMVFSDVVGQPMVTATLKNELKTGRIHHAYLFTGSRGTGKTTCAKILAKALNCLSPVDSDPCLKCENCVGIESGEIYDVVEMDAASNRGIDDIRAIIDEVGFAPQRAKYRVYIIDEVHMLTGEAWNALLKTLEEPPEHVVFILATTEVHKIPATILSRCQRFDFHHIKPSDIAARIRVICEKEGVEATDEALSLISVIADGALRDAISLLDRCISVSSKIDAETVRAAAGLASKEYLFEIVDCVINKSPARALEIIGDLYRESKKMSRLCDELVSHFRSLMLIKTMKDPRETLVMNDSEFERARTQSDYLSLADIIFCMDALAKAYERMNRALSERVELELAVVKLCAPELDDTDEAMAARVTALEKAVKLLSASKPAPAYPVTQKAKEPEPAEREEPPKKEETKQEPVTAKAEEPTPAPTVEPDVEPIPQPAVEPDVEPIPQPAVEPVSEPAPEQPERQEKKAVKKPAVDLNAVYENASPFPQWQDVIANLRNYSRAIAAAFEGTNAYESGDYLLIETDHEIAFELLKKSAQRDQIRKAVMEITGRVYRLGPYNKIEKKKKEDDVLGDFIETLKSSGINVTEE